MFEVAEIIALERAMHNKEMQENASNLSKFNVSIAVVIGSPSSITDIKGSAENESPLEKSHLTTILLIKQENRRQNKRNQDHWKIGSVLFARVS